MKRIIALCFLWTLTVAASLTIPPVVSAATTSPLIEQGRELFAAGETEQALAMLRGFVQRSPDEISPDLVEAYVLIARILLEQDNAPDALLYLQRIPLSLQTTESLLLQGVSEVRTGRTAEGLEQLRPLLQNRLDPADHALFYNHLVQAAIDERQYLPAIYYLQQQLRDSSRQATILEQAHDLLQNHLSDLELAEAAFMWQDTAIGQDALLQQARRALVRQQPEAARQFLEQINASSATFPYWPEAQRLMRRTSGEDSWLNHDSIGVLLPLSGPYASYGELVKQGLELALEQHNRTRLPARMVYRDTAQEGISPAQLVSRLTDDDKVMAIIGPLLTTHAGAAARRAQQEMVPMLTLAQGQGLPETGQFIFRDSLTPEQQVATLIDYALAKNLISFSVLYPDNPLGQRMSRLFTRQLREAGGEIVDVISYAPESTDFREPIQRLLWEDYDIPLPPLEPLPDEEELPELEYPLAPFHALFIPDYAERIGMIAPQLKFYGIKDVTLLGINGWNDPEILLRAAGFLENAVFVDAFSLASENPEVRRFIELYRQAYQEDPTILQAQAFDAASILLQMLDDPDIANRDDLRRKLALLDNYRGVTGTNGFDPFGEAIKDLTLLGVKGRRIIELTPPTPPEEKHKAAPAAPAPPLQVPRFSP